MDQEKKIIFKCWVIQHLKLKKKLMELGRGNLWTLSPGLYSLIFHNSLKDYTKNDLESYKNILIETSAHKRNY